MTDEYISRDKLMDIVGNMPTCWEYGQAVSDICKIIKGMPAADVAPVGHGQWNGEGDGYADGEIVLDVWHCSQCGYCIDDGTDNPDHLPKYCPGCGAKMDGGSDNGK